MHASRARDVVVTTPTSELDAMRLRLLTPTDSLLHEEVTKVLAEAVNGQFCLLPRHVDFVAALTPSILYYTLPQGNERFAAVDEGVIVKRGDDVLVSTFNAILGSDLERLQEAVAATVRELDEEERRARSALARLEAATMRRFLELERQEHG